MKNKNITIDVDDLNLEENAASSTGPTPNKPQKTTQTPTKETANTSLNATIIYTKPRKDPATDIVQESELIEREPILNKGFQTLREKPDKDSPLSIKLRDFIWNTYKNRPRAISTGESPLKAEKDILQIIATEERNYGENEETIKKLVASITKAMKNPQRKKNENAINRYIDTIVDRLKLSREQKELRNKNKSPEKTTILQLQEKTPIELEIEGATSFKREEGEQSDQNQLANLNQSRREDNSIREVPIVETAKKEETLESSILESPHSYPIFQRPHRISDNLLALGGFLFITKVIFQVFLRK